MDNQEVDTLQQELETLKSSYADLESKYNQLDSIYNEYKLNNEFSKDIESLELSDSETGTLKSLKSSNGDAYDVLLQEFKKTKCKKIPHIVSRTGGLDSIGSLTQAKGFSDFIKKGE
ncbi:MAG: hypothetical protein RSF39_09940 [Romboutsia sp.]